MNGLHRFRMVRLSEELQKEFGLPEFICADPESMPFPEGQVFYRWMIDDNACESVTASNYLNAILPFLTFLWFGSPSLRYTASPEQIRLRVRDYLKEKLGCVVRLYCAGNFKVQVTQTMTAPSVRLFLTALKRFYACAILKGWYADTNPLSWMPQLATLKQEFQPRMSPQSGMTLPENKKGRMPETYFYVVSGDWRPHILDDPNLPKLLLTGFAQSRDRLIARILFESGARVGEVLRLTLGDWRSRGLRERALATNKGSRQIRVKEIWWSSTTVQALHNYVNAERCECDPQTRRLEDLPDSAPLFLTNTGKAYTYAAFYANWQNACEKVNLQVTPHQARHWFVTLSLHKFESLASEKREAARQALIAYMGWRNPDTLQAYDHHLCRMNFAPTHATLARLIDCGESTLTSTPSPPGDKPISMPIISETRVEWLEQLLKEEESK
ncbi:MAG: site-specific integrase [Chloroflexi bacterium]|nr:site-specific integrase [Chloroflexota bacterium]